MAGMFIRQTRTNNKATGEGYFTFRLVRGERIGGKVRQVSVLNASLCGSFAIFGSGNYSDSGANVRSFGSFMLITILG